MATGMDAGVSEAMLSQERLSSRDFADQIRQLEQEGNQLLEATHTLGDSLRVPAGVSQSPTAQRTRMMLSGLSSSESLSALTDITAEQKTIDQLREQLDAQSRETERLQRSLAEPSFGLSKYPTPNLSSSLSALNLPSTTPGMGLGVEVSGVRGGLGASDHTLSASSHTLGISSGSSYSSRRSLEHSFQPHAERQLKEAQQELVSLRNRLREALRLSDEQKQNFRTIHEDLRRQLTAVIASRDSVLDLKNRESSTQEALITRLQATIDHLEQANRSQEQTLLQLNSRVESAQAGQHGADTILTQLRYLLSEQEKRRGRVFYDSEPISRQSATVLVHSVERCLTELESENDDKQLRLQQLTSEFETLKKTSLERQQSLSKQHQDRLTELAEAHDKELTETVERSMKARKQNTMLQEQLSMLQQQSEQQVNQKNDEIRDLQRKVVATDQQHEAEHASWKEQKEALESALDASQKELSFLKRENNEAIYSRAKSDSKIDSLQEAITQLEADLDLEKTQAQKASQQDEATKERLEVVSEKLTASEREVYRLQKLLDQSRYDSNAQLQSAVVSLEREEKERSAVQLSAVSERLTEKTDRFHALTLEHEVLKAEHKNLKERYHQLESAHEELTRRVEAANTGRDNLSTTLQERVTDIGRLSQDRDYYLKLSEEKNKEVSELRVEIDKLAVQLEERQKNFLLLKSQNDKMNELFDNTSTSTRNLREERDQLAEQFNACVIEREQLRSTQENLLRKMKIREKHIANLEDDNKQMAEVLAVNKEELEQLTQEKDSLFRELKDSRYEVSSLKEETQKLEGQLEEKEKQLRKEIHKLSSRLKVAEHDLRASHKALKTHEQVDGKAVRVAGKMQREVTEKRGQIDSLQSKLHWLEECLENTAKEKKVLKVESERLSSSLNKLVTQNERLTSEMGAMSAQCTDLRARVSKLEAALEKAAVKHAAAQAQVEQFEQDIARMKLKHQLELKELERTGRMSQIPPLVTVEASKRQTTLASNFGTSTIPVSTATMQHMWMMGRSTGSEPDVPVSQKPTQAHVQNFAATNGVGKELRTLLEEMRSLISSGQQQQQQLQQQQQQQHMQEKLAQQATVEGTIPTGSYQGYYPGQLSDGNNSTGSLDSEYRSRSSKDKYPRSKTKVSSRHVVSSPVKHKSSRKAAPVSVAEPSSPSSICSPCTSPVSDLLGDKYKYEDRINTGRPLIPTDTQVLCKRLEKKIENLSKMGTNIQLENKEMANLMKNQDVRLKKVRTSGRMLRS